MSFDLLDETDEPLRIGEVAHACRVHFSVVWRWIRKGVPAANEPGQRVRLEAVRAGRQWLISRSALNRFIAATTPRFEDGPRPAPRSPRARRKASERAEKALTEAGV
jgi:hypothetical protein